MKTAFVLTFSFLAIAAGFAAASTLYIRAGWVFDGHEMLDSRTIVVQDSLVEQVTVDSVLVPEGAQVIDARDQTVLPGFIESDFRFAAPALPGDDNSERYGPGRWVAEVSSAFPRARLGLLRNGVTGVVDADRALAAYPDFRRALAEGSVVGPELYLPEVEKGTRGSDQTAGGVFAKMASFEAAGGSRVDALTAVTSVAAELMGKDRVAGIVAPGARANLVFLRGAADTGVLSAERIARLMLHGDVVIENGRPVRRYARKFRENSVSSLAYPYWDPLLSYLLGANVTDLDLFRTGVSASVDFLYSVRNMWWTNVALGLPSPIPRTALRAGFHFDNQNRLFYGLGNDTKLGDTTEYKNLIFREAFGGTTRIARYWRLLTRLQFDQSELSDYGGQSLPDTLKGNKGGNETMLSLSFAHDTRDNMYNPRHGHYVAATVQAAPALLPGGHSFQKVALDIRAFASPFHRHTLAGRVLCQQAFGDVPFYFLPEFGGDTLGRGYLPFRFRDRSSIIGQFEYRFPVWSFIGGAVFADAGQFRSAPGGLAAAAPVGQFTLTGFHPSFGFGPRFTLGADESSMLGIDVGFTPEGWNLVLHNGQVF
jgi:hypothetical protein